MINQAAIGVVHALVRNRKAATEATAQSQDNVRQVITSFLNAMTILGIGASVVAIVNDATDGMTYRTSNIGNVATSMSKEDVAELTTAASVAVGSSLWEFFDTGVCEDLLDKKTKVIEPHQLRALTDLECNLSNQFAREAGVTDNASYLFRQSIAQLIENSQYQAALNEVNNRYGSDFVLQGAVH